MSYPCEMIKDLLPLFEDGVCSEESRRAVEEHLAGCEACRRYAAGLKDGVSVPSGEKPAEQDSQMAESLKKVRKKLDRRKKRLLAGAAAAVVLVAAAYQVLFVLPLKTVNLKDVSVSVEVYPFSELEKRLQSGEAGEVQVFADDRDNSVTITKGEVDSSETYTVVIPALSDNEIVLSGNVMEESEAVSVVTWSSPYFLREIRNADQNDQSENTLYVSAVKTTLLNNRAESYNTSISSMEFRALERVVFVNADGTQQLLWQQEK